MQLQDQYSGNNTYEQRYVVIPPAQALNSTTPIFLFTASEVALEYARFAFCFPALSADLLQLA